MIIFKNMKKYLLFALLCLPTIGFSQYLYEVAPFFSYFKDWERYEIGGNGAIMLGQQNGTVGVYSSSSGQFLGDTTIKRSTMSDFGYGGMIGLSVPVSRVGHISIVAVTMHLMYNMYIWENLNETYTDGGTFTKQKPSLNATMTQISFPVSFDYKIGCDAICTKRLRFGATVGAGLMPEYDMTGIEGEKGFTQQGNFTASPFIKLEGAVFAGICIKLRAQISYGSLNLLKVDRPVSTLTDGPFNMTGSANAVVSLVFMPFSMKWGETGWWNTHDTYNPYDKLN